MPWTKLDFSKHKGRTLPQVMFRDPGWFYWAARESVFDKRPDVKPDADRIWARASLVVPRVAATTEPEDRESELLVEYFNNRPRGRFETFKVVPRSRLNDDGTAPALRLRHIDFGYPFEEEDHHYDKKGGFIFIARLKLNFFGRTSYRMTRKRAEAFFDNDSNFDLGSNAA